MGALLSMAGAVGHVLAGGVLALGVARGVSGMGYAALMVGLMTVGYDVAGSSRRKEVANYLMASLQLGIGVGPAIGEGLMSAAGDGAVWAAAIMLLGLSLAAGRWAAPAEPLVTRDDVAARQVALLEPEGVVPGAIVFLAIAGFAAFLAFVPIFVEQVDGWLTGVLLVSSLTVIAFRLAAVRLADRLGSRATVIGGLLVQAAGLGAMGLVQTSAGLYMSTVVMSVGWAVAPPALASEAMTRVPVHRRTRVLATFTMFMDAGMAASPFVIGGVIGVIGIRGAFAAGGLLSLTGVGLAAHRIR